MSLKALTSLKDAALKWVIAGCPCRSYDDTSVIFDSICSQCNDFHNGRCGLCGCCVNKRSALLLNKIRMGTEHCPDGKW